MKKAYMIYMLKSEYKSEFRFMNYGYFKEKDRLPVKSMYDLIYTGVIDDDGMAESDVLEKIYTVLNIGERPEGYTAPSLSVSDIVVYDGKAQFVDSFGFKQIDGFYSEFYSEI